MTAKTLTLDPLFPDGTPAAGTRLTVSVDRDVAIVGSGVIARTGAAVSYVVNRDGTFPTIAVTPNDDPSLQDWSKGYALTIEAEATPAGGVTGGPWTVVITSLDPDTLSLSDLDMRNVVGLPPNISLADTMARLSTVEGEAADAVATSNSANSTAADALTTAQAANDWANQHGNIVSAAVVNGDLVFTLDDTPTTTLNAGAIPTAAVTDPAVAAVIGDTQTKAALDAAYAPTVDDATTASGKAVDLGHLPTYLLTTESRQVADIEYLFVRAQDSLTPGAVGGTTIGADMSAEFTAILQAAADANMRVILGPGDYFLSNVTVPDRTWIGSMGSIGTVFPASAKRGPVRLIHADPASGNPMMIFSGHGYVVEDVTCMGLPFAGTGVSWVSPMPASPYPPLFQLTEFFESQLRRVTFTNHPGEALRIDSASNSVFDRVQMKFVGHPTAAALRITGTGLTNSIDFDKLDMEFCPNNYIEVGALGSAAGKNVAEFIRFYAPHLESPDPKTIDASGGVTYYNDQALIRVGLAGAVDITDPFLYGSMGGLISHECPPDATTNMAGANNFLGGVSVKGGILLGRSSTANQNSTGTAVNNPYAVHLITGNGFHLSGTSMVRYATAAAGGAGVSIDVGYGPDVTVDPNMAVTDTTNLLVTDDSRATYAPTVVTDGGAGSGATATLAAGSDQFAGQITVTTGTSPIAGGFVKFNYPRARTAAKSVFVVAANQKAAQSGYYIGYNLSAGFQISLAVAPAASTAYTFNYRVSP